MSKLNFVSSLLVDVYVFLWLRPEWTNFPCKIITAGCCKWRCNVLKLSFVILQTSTSQRRIFICALMGTLRCQGAAGCAPWMYKWPFFAHRGSFSICSAPQLQRGVIVDLPHLINAMANIYLHFCSKLGLLHTQRAAVLFIEFSPSQACLPFIWWRWNVRGGLFGEGKEHITLHLGKHLSFRHIRSPVDLCGWLKQASKYFPWLKTDVLLSPSFMAHPVQYHRYHEVKGFCVMDILLWSHTGGMSSLPRVFFCIHNITF